MAMTQKQANIIAQAKLDGKTQEEACRLAGIGVRNAAKTCNSPRVLEEIARIQVEREKAEAPINKANGVKEPMTLQEYQAFLESRMLDEGNKDSARYAEMYGKTIRAFVDKVEVEQSVSYAEILSKRKKKS